MSTFATPSPLVATTPVRKAAARIPGISRSRVALGAAAIALILAGMWVGAKHLRYAWAHEQTDDAQVEGDISPVLPRVSGYVSRVLARDNQHVKAGQALVEIDARELDLKQAASEIALKTAMTALETARADWISAGATESVAAANAKIAAVRSAKATEDFRQDASLYRNRAISDRQFTDSRAAADIAAAEEQSADRQREAARAQTAIAQTRIAVASAQVEARKADLEFARLERSYATVRAPIDGVVSRKNVEPGQFVQSGQTLLSLASDSGVWIVANFKETQLARIREGQRVDISVDTYPGTRFAGTVESISGATGARFALLPPDNASGNYIKVTQRVPVRIALLGTAEAGPVFRPGMSVDAAIQIKD